MIRLYSDEERLIRHREANRRYRDRYRHTPEYKARKCADRKRYYDKRKSDPTFMERQRGYGRKQYNERIKTSEERAARHRETTLRAQQRRRERQQEVRKRLQQLLGGKCIRCGIDDYRLLDFDHVDPVTKTMNISQELHLSWERLVEETNKCQLLCPNCHRLKTMETRQFDSRIRAFRNPKSKSSFT